MKYFVRYLLISTACLHLIVPGYTQSKDSIDIAINKLMSEKHIPGFAACLVQDKSMTWSKGFGKANLEKDIAMDIDGIMNIGSVSKTFTATAAMQLWEKGLIDLYADVNSYLDFKVKNPRYADKPITIFQILTHTSSVIDGKAYGESYACGDPTMSLDNWIRACLIPTGKYHNGGDSYGDWAPGDKENYSNVAFGLLGLIVEKVTKQPFDKYCEANIFKPLGMTNTGWLLKEVNASKYINPYAYVADDNKAELLESKRLLENQSEFTPGTFVRFCLYSFPNYPDGLVRTSVRELSYFMIAMMNGGVHNGVRILKKETVDKMLTRQLGKDNARGLGWKDTEVDTPSGKKTLWGHTGGDPGIATYLFFDPVEKIGVITFQNGGGGAGIDVVRRIYRFANK